MLITVFLAACGASPEPPSDVRQDMIVARVTAEVAKAPPPALPEDCRRTEKGNVQSGDRLDIALLKVDGALARQNGRTLRCADWYDTTVGVQ